MKALWLSRLVKLERAQDGDNWELGSGLSSLLKGHEAAAALDPDWEPSDLDLEARALAGMLLEARRLAQKEGGHEV